MPKRKQEKKEIRSDLIEKDIYGCFNLTENEHYIVEDMMRSFCEKNGLNLLYYRKLKEGHVPMIREFKVNGPSAHGKLSKFMEDNYLDMCTAQNPHSVRRRQKRAR